MLHSGAFPAALHFFCGAIVGAPPPGARDAHTHFERFLTQALLFVHAVLKSAAYRGSLGASFEVNRAARTQARWHLPLLGVFEKH
jgi:hypothetical protein